MCCTMIRSVSDTSLSFRRESFGRIKPRRKRIPFSTNSTITRQEQLKCTKKMNIVLNRGPHIRCHCEKLCLLPSYWSAFGRFTFLILYFIDHTY